MTDPDAFLNLYKACLASAETFLNAAREVRKPGQDHVAYHLAVMALEEIGKASMILMSSARESILGESEEAEDESLRRADWLEDHERKLFWAMWVPSFGFGRITADQIREYRSLARSIHATRLATLYFDPSYPKAQEDLSKQELDSLFSLAEVRLNMERLNEFQDLDITARQNAEWFYKAIDDPQLKMFVLSQDSLSKLTELGGDAKAWMIWLRGQIEEMNRASEQLLQQELQRTEPGEEEGNKSKWEMKIRLRSWSHSIRPGPLNPWNKGSKWIKLFPTADKNELLVQFTLQKKIPIEGLWHGGWHVSYLFVISLNIGTCGYFWWYLPTFVSRFYEEIVDLEVESRLQIEGNLRLVVSWGHQALKEPQLNNVAVVFGHVARLAPNQRIAYDRYFRGLSLLAKNDMFCQFEERILVEFSESFRAGLEAYGDWDGATETFAAAVEKILGEFWGGGGPSDDMRGLLHLAAEVVNKKLPSRPITLEEVVKLKIYCDLYFLTRARRDFQKQAGQASSPATD